MAVFSLPTVSQRILFSSPFLPISFHFIYSALSQSAPGREVSVGSISKGEGRSRRTSLTLPRWSCHSGPCPDRGGAGQIQGQHICPCRHFHACHLIITLGEPRRTLRRGSLQCSAVVTAAECWSQAPCQTPSLVQTSALPSSLLLYIFEHLCALHCSGFWGYSWPICLSVNLRSLREEPVCNSLSLSCREPGLKLATCLLKANWTNDFMCFMTPN